MPELNEYLPKAFLERQGQDLPAVLEGLQVVRDELSQRLEILTDALYIPIRADAWSPAQIIDHLNHANAFFAKCLERSVQGKSVLTMPRGHITVDGRAINPAGEPRADRSASDLLRDHLAAFSGLETGAQAVHAGELLETVCVIQSFFGPLTGLELLRLAAWHTKHHTAQLPNH
jgi:DinB superfamily